MPLYTGDDLIAAAGHLAELDRDAAITALHDRLVDTAFEPMPHELYELLARLDHATACGALAYRVTNDTGGSEQVTAAKYLIELDPKAAEAALLEFAQNNHSMGISADVIRLFAGLNRSAAVEAVTDAIKNNTFGSDLPASVELLDDLAPELVIPVLVRRVNKRSTAYERGQLAAAQLLAARAPDKAVKPLARIAKKAFFDDVKEDARALLAELRAAGLRP
jgi:hypothetical protein